MKKIVYAREFGIFGLPIKDKGKGSKSGGHFTLANWIETFGYFIT